MYPRPAAVSELPGYPGSRHTRRSCYVTAEFPHEAISTIDENFTRAMPALARVWNRQCPRLFPEWPFVGDKCLLALFSRHSQILSHSCWFFSYKIKSGSGLGTRLSVCEVQHLCVHPREVTWFLTFTGRHSCWLGGRSPGRDNSHETGSHPRYQGWVHHISWRYTWFHPSLELAYKSETTDESVTRSFNYSETERWSQRN